MSEPVDELAETKMAAFDRRSDGWIHLGGIGSGPICRTNPSNAILSVTVAQLSIDYPEASGQFTSLSSTGISDHVEQ
jgi:hypothetical protein